MPDRGVVADYSWLKGHIPDGELQKIQAAATDRPQVAATWAIQGRNLKKMSDAGVRITVGTDGNTPWAPHVEMADMVAAGMTPSQVIVAATRNGAEFLRMASDRDDRERHDRRLPDPRRQPARRHHEHAEDLERVSARRRRSSARNVTGTGTLTRAFDATSAT